MSAYYNEIDPFAAQWLRNLIEVNAIAPGEVDERSIEDVLPSDLKGFTQCHFFAGIGGWSVALRQAGWPDDRPVWTGSCPCQPFSAAGKGGGFDDERHLWPSFHWLIRQCAPAIVVGEQVASKAAEPWIDLVQTDLEALGYAFGCVAFPAASVGAPHMRDRSYWLGHRLSAGLEGLAGDGDDKAGRQKPDRSATQTGSARKLADADSGKQQGQPVVKGHERHRENTGRPQECREPESCSQNFRLGHPDGTGSLSGTQPGVHSGKESAGTRYGESERSGPDGRPGPVNCEWRSADWLGCRDGKWRPVEPGTFPLADGLLNRVGRLRGYGNAIVPAQATEFIKAYKDYAAMMKGVEIVGGMNG